MDKTEEEIQLVQDILDGKRRKYRTLVDRYAPMVFSVVNRFVDNDQDAEELAQAIFVKTYERLSSFEGNSKFSSWLYMMNHGRDYAKNIRRNNRNFSEMDEHALQQQLEGEDSADRQLERQQWMELLEKGLESIGKDYAVAFSLKYEHNMSYKAMSKRLGASVSALKVRVHRAKKELKTFINENS